MKSKFPLYLFLFVMICMAINACRDKNQVAPQDSIIGRIEGNSITAIPSNDMLPEAIGVKYIAFVKQNLQAEHFRVINKSVIKADNFYYLKTTVETSSSKVRDVYVSLKQLSGTNSLAADTTIVTCEAMTCNQCGIYLNRVTGVISCVCGFPNGGTCKKIVTAPPKDTPNIAALH
ncbi:hypothetical protein [Chitinophaga vietnamensis]|uniref:hypothetical protein n=1 Tax=Chitinophaga vietnamensis TaxID=2593957 RepID=UPI001177938E|nr:hypothetical protein [Chitinophaga vietnamensis]